MMNQRVQYFHELSLSYFYNIKSILWITADDLQCATGICIQIDKLIDGWLEKNHVYTCIKNKLAQNFPGLIIPHQVNEKISFIVS